MPELILTFFGLFIALFSLFISWDNRRYVRFSGRVLEIKAAIMEVYEAGCQTLMREGEDSKLFFFQSCTAYRNLNALCRDNIELDSILGAKTVKPALNEFYKMCVAEDLVGISFPTEDGQSRMEDLERTRRQLVVQVEVAAKKLNKLIFFG